MDTFDLGGSQVRFVIFRSTVPMVRTSHDFPFLIFLFINMYRHLFPLTSPSCRGFGIAEPGDGAARPQRQAQPPRYTSL